MVIRRTTSAIQRRDMSDEKRFLSNINFDDNQSLDIAIPFFTKKIKKICQYYAQQHIRKNNNLLGSTG
jgi:hypothetical protein